MRYRGVPIHQQIRFYGTRLKHRILRAWCRLRGYHNWHEVTGRVTWTDVNGFQERTGTGTQCQTCATLHAPSVLVENINAIGTVVVEGSGCVVLGAYVRKETA